MQLIDLFERASSVLYHYTNVVAAYKILESGKFELSSVFGSIEEKMAPPGYSYFLSTTRTLTGGYHTNLGGAGVMFNLDGDFYNARYKAHAIDYWNDRNPQGDFGGRPHEAEDRIFSKTPSISAGGITSVHVYQEPMDEKSKKWSQELPGRIRRLILLAKTKGIPVYYYQDKNAWRMQDTRKTTPITKQEFSLQGDYARMTGTYDRKRAYLHEWLELMYKNKTSELTKRAASKAYDIAYNSEYWLTATRQSLETDFSNARKPGSGAERDAAVKMIAWMQKNGVKNVKQLVDVLAEKWRKIKDAEREPVNESYEYFDTIVDKIKAAVPAEEIWFHGSRATGTEHDESDWDILVIVPEDVRSSDYINVANTLHRIARNFEGFDVQPAHKSNHIARIAREEGELLWSISNIEEDIAPTTARLDVDVRPIAGKQGRTYFEGFLNSAADETPDWIRKALGNKRKMVVEAVAEIDSTGTCMIGFIQAHQEFKGFATELIKFVLDYYQDLGISNFKAYINHENSGSKNVFRKLGFTETLQQRNGSFWTLEL